MKSPLWSCIIVFLSATGMFGCTAQQAPFTEKELTSQPAPMTCGECIEVKCEKELGTCDGLDGCEEAKLCMSGSDGTDDAIAKCANLVSGTKFNYSAVANACVAAECLDACGREATVECGFNWVFTPELSEPTECEKCLHAECCEEGLACGRSPDCWSAWGCAISCFAGGDDCHPWGYEGCKYLPGWPTYWAVSECWSAAHGTCAELCGQP